MRTMTLCAPLAAGFLGLTALLVTAAPASAAWPTNPTVNVPVVAASARGAGQPEVAPDSCGGIIVVWSDGGTSTNELMVQRLDVFGQPRWALNGFPISPLLTAPAYYAISSDGAGGAYVAWSTVVTAATGSDVFVQHVLAAGLVDPAWPAAGLPVCSLPGNQEFPRIVTNGNGHALIAWSDSRANPELAPDIYAQRVSPTGAIQWTADGTPVVTQPGTQTLDDIAPDGQGLWVVWDDPNKNIAAQKLDKFGAPSVAFPAAGKLICAGTLFARQVSIASGGSLLVAWADDRSGATRDIYAQQLTPGGTLLWGANGTPVCVSPNNQAHPRIVSDDLGGAIVGWEDSDSGVFYGDRVVVQRLSGKSGSPLWALNGLPMCVSSMDYLNVVSDQRNGAIFTWHDFRNGSPMGAGDADVFAQRVSDTGAMLWTPNGVAISTAPGNQVATRNVPDGAGGAVLAWQDQRVGDLFDVDIYAQQVGATGLLGVRAPSKNCVPDLCGFAYTDFGDAPENAPVYPSGSFGHFPTCNADSPSGTQELACGAAPSTPPGPTGYVEHVATLSDASYFGLGCGPANAQKLAVDHELDGVVYVSGGLPVGSEASTCSPAVTITNYESAFGGLWFGADETAGDGIDAGIAGPVTFLTCVPATLPFKAWSCGPASIAVRLNVLVDWNQDGDWNDVVTCGPPGPDGCAPEWAVKNASIVLQPGCNSIVSPSFPVGPGTGGAWMRVTLTTAPVSDDFPWAGSGTETSPGAFAGGETEDYPISIATSTAAGQTALPEQLLLAAPSPNPTRAGADIRYALPHAADVRLGVFDVAGRRVRVLASGRQEAGAHVVRWDGRDAAGVETSSGLYFVKLDAEGKGLTRAVVRVR